jgi:hypothetical protein
MESFVDGSSTSCLIAENIECADDGGPSRNTHGDFICDGEIGRSRLRSYLNLDLLS